MELRNRTIGTQHVASGHPSPRNRSSSNSLIDPSNSTPKRTSSKMASSSTPVRYSWIRITLAWLVHFYTATGLLVNMYSLLRLVHKPDFNLFTKLNWLAIAIDATDGTLARAVDIKKVVPTYDGAMLDNIIDFQTFSVLPALAIIVFDIVPGTTMQMTAAGLILIASAYQFCQTVAKTSDAFVGFPSYWNVVLFYVFYLQATPIVTMVTILSCTILSFIPLHFIYPTRTTTLAALNLGGAYVWSGMMLFPAVLPESPYIRPVLYASFVYVLYYIGLSVVLDTRRRKEEAKNQ